ncbi:hypothetical protein BHE74_00006899, partial [Ensete ventricosum]
DMSDEGFLEIHPTELKFPCNRPLLLNCQFNKEPGKVVDEFKLRVVYVPAGPPSPVHEESEEGSSPRSSTFENGTQSLQTLDSVSSSNRLKPLDLLRKERGMHHGGFSVTFVVLVGLLGALIGYIIKKS